MMRRRVSRTLALATTAGVASMAIALPGSAAAAERGIELISPAESLGLQVLRAWGSPDVDRAFFASDQLSSGLRSATRSAAGWTSGAPLARNAGVEVEVVSLSADGTRKLVRERAADGPAPGTRTNGFYLHADGQSVKPLLTYPNPGIVGGAQPVEFYGTDENVRQVYLSADPGTLDGPTSASRLYRWNDPAGRYDAVEINDPRVHACGSYTATFGGVTGVLQNGISADGSRVIVRNAQCTVPGSAPPQTVHPHLYIWSDGVATDITKPPPGEADGAANFRGMSPDASRVFFTSTAKLTPDSSAGVVELYVHESGQTTRISGPSGSTLREPTIAVSGDGSTVWFAVDSFVNGPQRDRLIRWHDGSQQEIAAAPLNAFNRQSLDAEVSRDGSALMIRNAIDFTSRGTGGTNQFHRFAVDGTVTCVSCPPAGVPVREMPFQRGNLDVRRPYISADGSAVAFHTPSAISPVDVNGDADVYLWQHGVHTLISSGTVNGNAEYRGMSWDASRLYFVSWGALLPGITDVYTKLYVSRVGGGFPPPVPDGDCGDDCQGPVTPQPVLPGQASMSFFGPGNVVPAAEPRAAASTARVRATRPRVARGTRTTVSVRVPARGTIRTSGWGLRRESRRATRATTYRVPVRLTQRAARTLRSKGSVRTRVTVRFTPTGGRTQTVRVAATFRRAANARTNAGGGAR